MRFVDLSLTLKQPAPGEMHEKYAMQAPKIDYFSHADTVQGVCEVFNCKPEDLPGGLGWSSELVTLTTHSGTHVDAPWHYYITSEGKASRTIDEMPLEWFFSDGVVLDLRHKKPGEETTVEDIKAALEKINYTIKPRDIVMMMYGMDKKHDEPSYWTDFPGMSAEATHWLIDQGVKVIGTDAFGFDIPFEKMRENYEKTGDRSKIWPAHRVGMEKEYCQIEKLANLDKLPPYGFKVACFPISIYKASAGWARVVAIIED